MMSKLKSFSQSSVNDLSIFCLEQEIDDNQSVDSSRFQVGDPFTNFNIYMYNE